MIGGLASLVGLLIIVYVIGLLSGFHLYRKAKHDPRNT